MSATCPLLDGDDRAEDGDGPLPLSHRAHSCTLTEACHLTSPGYVYACFCARACGSAFISFKQAPLRFTRALWGCGLACSLLSTTAFSCSSLCIKMTAGRLPVLQVAATRSLISLIISVVLAYTQGVATLHSSRANLKWLLLRGVFGALAMTTYYVAIFSLPLGDAVTIGLIQPPLTALVSWLALGEAFFGLRGVLGCAACLGGVVIVAHPPFLFGGHQAWSFLRTLGVSMDVLSCVLGAVAVCAIRVIGRHEHPITIALWFHICAITICAVPLALGWPQQLVLPQLPDVLLLLAVAVTSFAGQILMARGLQLIPAAQVSVTSFAQVIYSNLWGFLLFNEPLTPASTGGAALIVLGVLVATYSTRQHAPSPALAPRPSMERAHSLLHKLLVRCPQCGLTNEAQAPGAEPAGAEAGQGPELCSASPSELKLPLLSRAGSMQAPRPISRTTSWAQQLLSDAVAGSEACTARAALPPAQEEADAEVQPAQCCGYSSSLHASGHSLSGAASAASMLSAHSSLARYSSAQSDFTVGAYAPRRASTQDGGV